VDGELREENTHAKASAKDWKPVHGHYQELVNRDIKEATCKFWSYEVGERDGVPSHIMNIYDQRRSLIAQKFRTKETKGSWIGEGKDPPLYGQWLWGGKGKSVTITEGEIDAMSVSQAFDLKWPVVSLPNGCGSVNKALAKAYEWLDGYDSIVLMFDQDDAGRDALEAAVELLPVGKVKIAKLPSDCKDANDTLRKHGPKALVNAFWNAETWRPDGIVEGAAFTRERVKKATAEGYKLPCPILQEKVLGLRKAELTLITAGSGIGKSTWARELAYDLNQTHGLKIGNIFLEEQNNKTVQGYVALHCGVPLGRLRQNPDMLSDQQWDEALAAVVNQRMWFYDHFGSLAADNLISKIRYLAVVCKVDFIVLDHISIVTSGIESSSEGERKDIDILMTRLQSVCQETGVGILAIVHLKRKQGTSFNNGGQISLSDLRGSGSLEQLSDNVYGLERDQQAEGSDCCKSTVRVLKCRETGDTGEADELLYDRNIGRNVLGVDHVFDVNAETMTGETGAF
jgi:twinkle protein